MLQESLVLRGLKTTTTTKQKPRQIADFVANAKG